MAIADPTPLNYICRSGAGSLAAYKAAYGAEKAASMLAIYQGCSPHSSFMVASNDYGLVWSGASKFGCIVGFALFGIMYLFTIVRIILDIFKRQAEYENMVSEDKSALSDLGIDVNALEGDL
jgi:hypothetical protein